MTPGFPDRRYRKLRGPMCDATFDENNTTTVFRVVHVDDSKLMPLGVGFSERVDMYNLRP